MIDLSSPSPTRKHQPASTRSLTDPLEIREALRTGTIQSILFVRPGRVGDLLFVTPILRRFRDTYSTTALSVLTSNYARRILEYHPLLTHLLSYNHKGFWPLRRWELRDLASRLRAHRFDLAVFLSETAVEACFERLSLPYSFHVPPAHVDGPDRRGHTIERLLERLAPLGVAPPAGPMEVFYSPAEVRAVDAFLERHRIRAGERLAVVHPGCFQIRARRFRTMTARRVWPAENFSELARKLGQDLGLRVILSGSGRDEARRLRQIARGLRFPPALATGLDILELAALLERAALFVSVDTGPMHVAAAMRTPLIALFGPSPVHLTRPWGQGPHVVHWEGQDLPCSPCRGKHISCSDNVCMKRITVDAVVASARRLLGL